MFNAQFCFQPSPVCAMTEDFLFRMCNNLVSDGYVKGIVLVMGMLTVEKLVQNLTQTVFRLNNRYCKCNSHLGGITSSFVWFGFDFGLLLGFFFNSKDFLVL